METGKIELGFDSQRALREIQLLWIAVKTLEMEVAKLRRAQHPTKKD